MQVTGSLADALNWAGISEDDFNEKLSKCTKESERNRLIMDTLSDTYNSYSKQFKENNKQLIESRKNQADLNRSLSELGSTVSTIKNSFSNQFTPSIIAATKSLNDMLSGAEGAKEGFANAISGIVESATKILPQFIEYGTNIITSIIQGFSDSAPNITGAISNILTTIGSSIAELLPSLGELGINIITSLGNGIAEALPDVVTGLIDGVMGLISNLIGNIDQILLTVANLATGIVEAVMSGIGSVFTNLIEMFSGVENQGKKLERQFENALSSFVPFAEALRDATPDAVNYSLAISEAGNSISDLDSKIRIVEDQITDVLKSAFREQGELRDEDIADIEQYMEDYTNLQLEKLSIFQEQQRAELIKISQAKTEIEAEEAPKYIANVQAALDQANQITEDYYTSKIALIESSYTEEEKITNENYQTALNNATKEYNALLQENQKYADDALAIIQNQSQTWIAEDAKKWEELSKKSRLFAIDSEDNFNNIINKANDFMGNYTGVKVEYMSALEQMTNENASAFLAMAVTTAEKGGEIEKETLETVNYMLTSFQGLPPGMSEAGKEALLSLISGLEDQIPELKNASNMSANEIVAVLKDKLGITGTSSTVTYGIGSNVSQGLINGINSKKTSIFSTLSDIAYLVSSTFSSALGEHSPSKVFEKHGINVILGLINGIKSNNENRLLKESVNSIEDILVVNEDVITKSVDDAYKKIANRIKLYFKNTKEAEKVNESFFKSVDSVSSSTANVINNKLLKIINNAKENSKKYVNIYQSLWSSTSSSINSMLSNVSDNANKAYKETVNIIERYNGEVRNSKTITDSFFDSLYSNVESSIESFDGMIEKMNDMISKIKDANNALDTMYSKDFSEFWSNSIKEIEDEFQTENSHLDKWNQFVDDVVSSVSKSDSTVGQGISGIINNYPIKYPDENKQQNITLYLDDSTKLATWIIEPLDKVSKSMGTPIIREGA